MATKSLPGALENIAQLLKTQDDLDKIPHLKEQLEKEKSIIEVELKTRSQIEIEKLLETFQNLQVSSTDLKKLKLFIKEINELAGTSFKSIENYESINKLTKIHEIFEVVTFIIGKISNFDAELQEIEEMIEEEDYDKINCESKVTYLLPIHYRLTILLNFKDLVLELSHFSNEDSRFIIKKLVKKIDLISVKFDLMLKRIIESIIDCCKVGNYSLVIRLFKILHLEEQQDLKVRSQRSAVLNSSSNDKDNETIIFEQIINGNLLNSRLFERGYKDFFLKKCEEFVHRLFQDGWEEFNSRGSTTELFEILDNLDFIFEDLGVIKEVMVKVVPPNWDLFKIFYDIYFAELHSLLNKLIEKEPETAFILEIIKFEQMFKDIMKAEFNVFVKTVIGEKEKDKLADDYLNLTVSKSTEWMHSVMKSEQEVFKSRLTPPELDAENLYGLEGNKDAFKIVTQQFDLSLSTGQGKILEGVIVRLSALLMERQTAWSKLIQSEVSRLILQNHRERSKKNKKKENDDENEETQFEQVPPGLNEYLIALGNDQMRGADYTEAYSNAYGPAVHKKYQVGINDSLEKTIDGFADLGKQCCDALIVIILDDVTFAFDELFEKSWLKQKDPNPVKSISDTIYEYLGEFKETMNQYLFEILTEELIDESILRYLKNLNKDTSIFKDKNKEKFFDVLRNDFKIFYEMFTKFLDEPQVIRTKFEIVEEVIDFLSIEGDSVEDENIMLSIWEKMVRDYHDIPLHFFEQMVRFKGYNKSQVKKILPKAELKQRNILQLEISANMVPKTFMGRL